MELTQARLRELFNYDPKTGVFTRKVRTSNSVQVGDVAGTPSNGYTLIRVNSKFYRAHRLAWLYTFGVWPTGHIDHKNGVGSDNRLANLRDGTRSANLQNQRSAHTNNGSGYLGVTPSGNNWIARIRAQKVMRYLGTFPTAIRAHEEYLRAKRRLHLTCTI